MSNSNKEEHIWKVIPVHNTSYNKSPSLSPRSKQSTQNPHIIDSIPNLSVEKKNAQNLLEAFYGFDESQKNENSTKKVINYIAQSDFRLETEENQKNPEKNDSFLHFCPQNEKDELQPVLWQLNARTENFSQEFEKLMNLRELILQVRNAQQESYQEIVEEKEKFKSFLKQIQLHFSIFTDKVNQQQQKYQKQLEALQNEKQKAHENHMREILNLQTQLRQLQVENQLLNEKIFDAEQRVAQADLIIEKKIQERLKSRQRNIRKEYTQQVQKLQEQIENLSYQLLNNEKVGELKEREEILRKRQEQIEEQYEEVAKQHTLAQQKYHKKQQQLQQFEQKLYSKMEELDLRENQLYSRNIKTHANHVNPNNLSPFCSKPNLVQRNGLASSRSHSRSIGFKRGKYSNEKQKREMEFSGEFSSNFDANIHGKISSLERKMQFLQRQIRQQISQIK